VLKRKANLTSLQRFRLRDLLRYNLKPDFNTFPVRRLLRSAQRIDLT
jgi:hypothetical protein